MTHTLKGQLKARLDKQLVSLREHFAGAIADLPKQGGYTQEQLPASALEAPGEQ